MAGSSVGCLLLSIWKYLRNGVESFSLPGHVQLQDGPDGHVYLCPTVLYQWANCVPSVPCSELRRNAFGGAASTQRSMRGTSPDVPLRNSIGELLWC